MTRQENLKGVIFDLDGTLANTRLDFAAMCREVELPTGTPLLEYCDQLSDRKQADYIHTVIKHHEMRGAHQAEWIDGAEEMLSQLSQAKIPMAIVTRNMRKAAMVTIDKLGIPIKHLVTREDCQPKPSPDGLLMVSDHWKIAPDNIAYVGDYKFDLVAAKNAGMKGFLKLNSKNSHFSHLADKVLTEFRQLTELFVNPETLYPSTQEI